MSLPSLTLQTGTLYASADDSTFTGSGGPWGFSPYTFEFGGVVSSAGLLAEPFQDTVYQVASGDEVIFVIAVQNLGAAAAYDVRVRANLPTGFATPPEGTNLTVTDGSSTDLGFTGDLFSSAGLQITPPIAAYDPDSGSNLVLITYALAAGAGLPGPEADVRETATLVSVAAAPGGAALAQAGSASTDVITAGPTVTVTAEGNPQSLAKGQTIAYDVTIAFPAGSIASLNLASVLPAGVSNFDFVSAAVLSQGTGLTTGTPTVGADGTLHLGTVAAIAGGDDTLTARIVLKADGTASGVATLQSVVSSAGGWSAEVDSSVGVVLPPAAPSMTGFWTAQRATTTMTLHAFGGLTLGGSGSQTGTLAITLQDGSTGRLSGNTIGALDSTGRTWVATGTFTDLQTAARNLLFTPSGPGDVRFGATLVDSHGGIAQDSSTDITVEQSADTTGAVVRGAVQPNTLFYTATANGQQTVVSGQQYTGANSSITSEYVYDGTGTIAIATSTPNVYVDNLVGTVAVALASGQNVVDAGIGSNYLVSGSGNDSFYLDTRSGVTSWNTIVNFHAGDVATLWGVQPAMATRWDDLAGAVGSLGRTLRIDTLGNGSSGASLTFAGESKAVTDQFTITIGQANGVDFMKIVAA